MKLKILFEKGDKLNTLFQLAKKLNIENVPMNVSNIHPEVQIVLPENDTIKEIIKDKPKMPKVSKRKNKKRKVGRKKIPKKIKDKVIDMKNDGRTRREIGNELGICKSSIGRIFRERRDEIISKDEDEKEEEKEDVKGIDEELDEIIG